MRSSWLVYIVLPGQNQQNASTVFLVAVVEIFRRFMWNFFRVENAHMMNASRFIVSRNVPLPFSLPEFKQDKEATMEVDTSFLDYARGDEGRAVDWERDDAGFDC